MKRRNAITAAVATLIVVVTLPLFVPVRRAYHRYRFHSAHDATLAGNDDARLFLVLENDLDVQEYHLRRLVAIGDISHARFTLPQVTNNSGARRKLARDLLDGNCPTAIYWESPAPGDDTPMVLEVWCEHTDAKRWGTFLKALDQKLTRENG